MSSTLQRLGLWIILIVVALYVLHETYAGLPIQEYFSMDMMTKALALGGLLLIAGFVMRVLEKGAKVVKKNRCVVCKTPIAPGAIYCRAHLRNVLAREDERVHVTRTRS
jgi:predicted nucleic acid-binding Zn ribbon protein